MGDRGRQPGSASRRDRAVPARERGRRGSRGRLSPGIVLQDTFKRNSWAPGRRSGSRRRRAHVWELAGLEEEELGAGRGGSLEPAAGILARAHGTGVGGRRPGARGRTATWRARPAAVGQA